MPQKYFRNHYEHLKELYAFRERLRVGVLGEQDQEWRAELEFILKRTDLKIRQIEGYIPDTSVI